MRQLLIEQISYAVRATSNTIRKRESILDEDTIVLCRSEAVDEQALNLPRLRFFFSPRGKPWVSTTDGDMWYDMSYPNEKI